MDSFPKESMKILVCGSVFGQIAKFFRKVTSIHEKNGPFEMVLCIGDFFSPSDQCKKEWKLAVDGKISVPLPVFLLGPSTSDVETFYGDNGATIGAELCRNVSSLGKRGKFKTVSGLQVAYVSGMTTPHSRLSIGEQDMEVLLKNADDSSLGVDVLLTSAWPKDVLKFVKSEVPESNPSAILSRIAAKLRPRYIFSASTESFFERPPYRNHLVLQGDLQHVTRFISLAPFNNKSDERAIYAFSIVPLEKLSRQELVKQPAGTTEFPFGNVLKDHANAAKDSPSPNSFFFSASKRDADSDVDSNRPRKVAKGAPKFTGPCWFCLGSKEVEKHLVVSVGSHCYVAMAKGGINEDHCLICPIAHHNSTVVLPDEARLELEKFRRCLKKMFASEKKSIVTFERNFYTQHLQLQVMATIGSAAENVKETFLDFAQMNGMDFAEVPDGKDITEMVAVTTPFFMVEFEDGERLLHKVKGKMPIQFGREVLTSPSLLNLPDRVNWKDCTVSKEEEGELTKAFRKRFTPFDFNVT